LTIAFYWCLLHFSYIQY